MFVVLAGAYALADATVTETTVTMPTYPYSDPAPVPCVGAATYPYFRYDGSSATSAPRDWNAVVLENSKTRITIMPEIGGKVWGAVDKRSGHEYIYFNHAVKFRDIAMRGPWCSGGIEFNFGILGHAPWTATPVDWTVRKNGDGSASCFVGLTELINRTFWQVEIRLGSDDDFFETRTLWHNGSGAFRPYYNWMTAAYSSRGDPWLCFPGTAYIGHEGDAHAFPRDAAGRDLSVYKGNAFGGPKSYHVLNGANGVFGIWWPEWNLGSMHQSASYDKYGRKIWLWALSRNGGIWEDLLTDTDGQYIELQAGRAFNQPRGNTYRTPFKHPHFKPGGTDMFVERWAPVRSLAELEGLAPKAVARPRPLESPADFDWTTPFGLTMRAEQELYSTKDAAFAEERLREALKRERHFIPALNRLSAILLDRGHYDEAMEFSEKALSINTYDAEANYNSGLAAFRQGDMATARERFGLASYSPDFRSAAYVWLAKIALRQGNAKEAADVADRALASSPEDPEAMLSAIIAGRLSGAKNQAILDSAMMKYPLYHAFTYEADRIDNGHRVEDAVRNELPAESFMELASWYEEAGLVDDAVRIYGMAKGSPIAVIRKAYLIDYKETQGRRGAGFLACAERMPIDLTMPSRPSSLPALRWAAGRKEAPWKFRYYLSLLLAHLGDGQEAEAILDGIAEADSPIFYLYRASRRSGESARRDLMRAKAIGDSWRVGYALFNLAASENDWKSALAETTEYIPRYPHVTALQLVHAEAFCGMGEYDKCIDWLSGLTVLPSEHGRDGHGIWEKAWLSKAQSAFHAGKTNETAACLAKAFTYPENIGQGKPYDDCIVTTNVPESIRFLLPSALRK